ncbi:hypothetical protein ACFL3P_00920 [Pseudomonadota bacterium]
MTTTNKIWLLIVLTITSHGTYASGQRTTSVTEQAIGSYKELKLDGATILEPSLHYIGSVGQSGHIFMITKTAFPPKEEVEPGVFRSEGHPWDHVFKYFMSADEMTIVNGWDISDKLKTGGFEVRPSYCPKLSINPEQKTYHINPHAEIKAACMEMRRIRSGKK